MRRVAFVLLGSIVALAGCGGDGGGGGGGAAFTGEPAPVAIEFAAVVGDEPFACDRAYAGVGTSASTIEPLDFRFYVSNVVLIGPGGDEHAVELEQDGLWQNAEVALIDFEDASGSCANGTQPTNTTVRGIAPHLPYAAVRFELGVPAPMNHEDASAAASPLNLTALFWNWNAGYKFLRADSRTTGLPAFNIHLGSTGCQTVDRVTQCSRSNRVVVELSGFDPESSTIVADLAALLATSNVDVNEPETAPGCMSGTTDPECGPIFERLGLELATGAAQPARQAFFRLR